MIITLDGPVASGKSTLCKEIARRRNFFYLYSGIFYRAYAYLLDKIGVNLLELERVQEKIESVFFLYENDKEFNPIILFEDKNIINELKSEEIGKKASLISSLKFVREKILIYQREIAKKNKNIIADGRDCGINVFPNADYKFFIIASLDERVKRMAGRNNNDSINREELYKFITERDFKDTKRKIDPLLPAKDAYIFDTTNFLFEEVVDYIVKIIK